LLPVPLYSWDKAHASFHADVCAAQTLVKDWRFVHTVQRNGQQMGSHSKIEQTILTFVARGQTDRGVA